MIERSVHKLPVAVHVSADSSDLLRVKYSAYFGGVGLLPPTVHQGEKNRTWHTDISGDEICCFIAPIIQMGHDDW
jgi:hypothetical protein